MFNMKHFIPNQRKSSKTMYKSGVSFNGFNTNPIIKTEKFFRDLTMFQYGNLWNDFKVSKKLPYVIEYQNLPVEIKSKVLDIVKKKSPVIKQCFLYSQFISSQIEGVKQVLGFFKLENSEYFLEYLYETQEQIIPFKKYNILGSDLIFDEKFNCWGIHGWNEYNGVYFDCMNEEIYKKMVDYKFTEYRIVDYSRKLNYDSRLKLDVYNNYTFISSSFQEMVKY